MQKPNWLIKKNQRADLKGKTDKKIRRQKEKEKEKERKKENHE